MSNPSLRLLLLDPQPESELAFVRSLVPETALAVSAPPEDDPQAVRALLGNAEAIVTREQPVTAQTLAAAPNLRLVQKYGGRPDRIDLDAAQAAGVAVAVMPLRGCIAVAELTLTLILALSKQLIDAHRATVEGAYRELGLQPARSSQRVHAFQWMKLPNLQEIRGKRLGVVGFGEIGTEVAKRANAFGMEVVYYKREPLPAWLDAQLNVQPLPFDELLRTSDFVTLHVPHGPATDKLIGARELGLMQPSAYLVNTCRGPVVDEAALVAALQAGAIAGAGLDVFEFEPLQWDSPLTQLSNVILTPHIGGGTGGAREKQMQDVLDNILRFSRGEEPLHRLV
ncbi:MAG: phosphoglycerate dehydrogenase [Chloroflexi bacterium]|nr:MAG: phosphoglycerate dehydrogenase [Chloroflexota bacterium]